MAVHDCTRYLGCGEQPLQFLSLQLLGGPVSSIDCLPFPLVCRLLWCCRSFCAGLVNLLWMFNDSVYGPLENCVVACGTGSWCFWCSSIPQANHLDGIEYVYFWSCDSHSPTGIAKIVIFVHEVLSKQEYSNDPYGLWRLPDRTLDKHRCPFLSFSFTECNP